MLTNFTMNDFLLGVMVLCLVVHVRRKSISRKTVSVIDVSTEVEVVALLEQAYAICVEKSTLSKDSRRVARAVRLVVDGTKASSGGIVPQGPALTATAASSDGSVDLENLSLQPQVEQPYMPEPHDFSIEQLDPFSFMGNDFENADWMLFEA